MHSYKSDFSISQLRDLLYWNAWEPALFLDQEYYLQRSGNFPNLFFPLLQ